MTERKVLFVEDDPDLQLFVKKGLSLKGIKVIAACNAEEALSSADGAQLVLSDLSLPDMEFADFWDSLKNRDDMRKVPLIIASGREDAGFFAEKFGALSLLKKPYSLKDLSETVSAVFSAIEEFPLRITG